MSLGPTTGSRKSTTFLTTGPDAPSALLTSRRSLLDISLM